MKLTVLILLLFISIPLLAQDSISKSNDLLMKIDSIEIKVESNSSQIIKLNKEITEIDKVEPVKKNNLPVWALVLSIVNLILMGYLRYYHVQSIKKIQKENEILNWNQLTTKLIGELITEIDFPSGENFILRLKKSDKFNNNINQLLEIFKFNAPDKMSQFQFLSDWKKDANPKILKQKLRQINQILNS